ncbi:unnamed protein product [marine sediment metagenome]|uniref:Uncharacterized protein n=1 Tax=marine sediment metagenome TaxID=412755 RepID=X1HFW2_9ZZZZ
MKDEIKELIKLYKEWNKGLLTIKQCEEVYQKIRIGIPNLITEIESFTAENQKQQEIIKTECNKAAKYETLSDQQQEKIEELKEDRDDLIKQREIIKWIKDSKIKELETKIKELDIGLVARTLLKQENEELKAVREAAKRVKYSRIIRNGIDDSIIITEDEWDKLQQALAKVK